MLSRTASSLYWLGRYIERADFTARLVAATLRLDTLSAQPAGNAAWASALAVTEADQAYHAAHRELSQRAVAGFLTLDGKHDGSIACCLEKARGNARAVRTGLTREAWATLNQAWMTVDRNTGAGNAMATLQLMNAIEAATLGFEGAVHRMMRSQSSWFIRLGQAIERADNTARLIDVKYHLLLPADQEVGGPIDRDQWTTILQTVSAVTAYRWLYSEGLTIANVLDLLLTRQELPRSLAAAAEEVVELLGLIGKRTGFQGEADRLARSRYARVTNTRSREVIANGLHEHLQAFLDENAALHHAIGRQFRF